MDLEQKMLDFALLGAGWVMWLLVALSVLCVGVAIERAIFLMRNTSKGPRQGAMSFEYVRTYMNDAAWVGRIGLRSPGSVSTKFNYSRAMRR